MTPDVLGEAVAFFTVGLQPGDTGLINLSLGLTHRYAYDAGSRLQSVSPLSSVETPLHASLPSDQQY